MKGFKQKLSWLLVVTMILGQASFASFADSDDDEYDYEMDLVNDLHGGVLGSGREKAVKWSEKAVPKVTSEQMGGYQAYYANGNDITIIASASNTYIVEDKTGAYTELEGAPYIYAGATASNASYDSVNITVADGEVDTIVGSNRYAGKIGTVNVKMNAGTVGMIIANQGSNPGVAGGKVNNGGASSYANRKDYKVNTANIEVTGGELEAIVGTYGYTYIDNLNITVSGDTVIGEAKNAEGILAGANGEVNKAVFNVDGGDISAISAGQRAYVNDVTYNLTGGHIDAIYAGNYYPVDDHSPWGTDSSPWGIGDVNYGKAKKLSVHIGEELSYGDIFAGIQMQTGELKEFNEKYSNTSLYKALKDAHSDYFTSDPAAIEINVAAAAAEADPSSHYGVGVLRDVDNYNNLKEQAKFNFPTVAVENGTMDFAEGAIVGTSSALGVPVMPGTTVKVQAKEAGADERFTGWTSDALGVDFVDEMQEQTEFVMPGGMDKKVVTAKFADKEIYAEKSDLTLDLNNKEWGDESQIVLHSDYASPSVASYDNTIINVEQVDENEEDGEWTYLITAVGEGTTTVEFHAEGTSKTAKLPVTVIDTTPVLTVEGGTIVSIGGVELEGNVTSRKIAGGKGVVIRADVVDDKKFTGWNGAQVAEDGYMEMPVRDTAVAARYEDKVFKFADGTKDEVTLNVDQSETNTEGTPDTFTFKIESDYASDRIEVSSTNENYAAVTANEDGSYTVKAVGAGMTTILAALTKDNGSVTMQGITINVADTTKKTEAGNGKADINTDNAQLDKPEIPDGIEEEKAEELAAELETKIEAAITSITENEAAKTGVSGFDRISENTLLEAGIPAGARVVIYPKQELKKVETAFEESKSIDPVTNTEVVTYTPVVKKIVFDIKPYAASNEGSGTEKALTNIKGSFRFRIPVPSTISASARYAKLTHTSDQGGVVSGNQYLTIQEENGQKYVNVTANHFSIFELEFTTSKPDSGSHSGGGGGGGSSRTTTYTGKWVLDAKGWWYQYADRTYPVNGWAYLAYAANDNRWYHFDANGYMQTGWFTDTTGHRYYLHPVSDGTMGYMYTGWHEIDGKWYYFTTAKTETNPVGSLLVDTTTPDGYTVGADGARIQ